MKKRTVVKMMYKTWSGLLTDRWWCRDPTPSDAGRDFADCRIAGMRFVEHHAQAIFSAAKTHDYVVNSKGAGSTKKFKAQWEAGRSVSPLPDTTA